MKADLATGRVTPLTGTDLLVSDFAVSPAGDLVALVASVQKNVSRVYIQPLGPGAGPAVPLPATGAEQMASPAFMP